MLTDPVTVWECVACMVGITLLNAWVGCRVLNREHTRHLAEIKRMGEIAGQMTADLAAENTELRRRNAILEGIAEGQAAIDRGEYVTEEEFLR